MSTSVYQSVSTMTPRFATTVLKPLTLSSSPALFSYQCGECPRRFSRRYALQEHLATHTGEKAYACPAKGCGKRFTTTSNLARHRRLHGDELQPMRCPLPSCTKTFTTAHKLRRHMRVHLGTPTRRCKFANCNKTFSSTGNLNRHMRNQHIKFGHPLARDAVNELSPTSVDASASMFAWKADSVEPMALDGDDVSNFQFDVGSSSEHDVSDEELLEVLSCLLDDEPANVTNDEVTI